MKEITLSKVVLVCRKCSLQLDTNQTLNHGCSQRRGEVATDSGAWLSKPSVK